jgi:galactokinase
VTIATTADAFAGLYHRPATGVWSAPGRVNLIGEHTDYNRGLVLPFAINYRTTCAAALNNDGVIRVASDAREGVRELAIADFDHAVFSEWTGYALGVPWAMAHRGLDMAGKPGLDLFLTSDVPIGAGLSSSAAIESAVGVAVDELWGLGLSRMELAAIGQTAENEAVGAPTGIMDQVASLMGAADHAVMLDCDSLTTDLVSLGFEAAGLTVLVLDSRVAHRHADGGYASRRAACEQGAAALGAASLREITLEQLEASQHLVDHVTYRRMRHVITENARVGDTVRALREAGPSGIGALMGASHASMRDDFEISVPEIDLMVETAIANGAVGARLTGGGFGGSAIAVVPHDAVPGLTAAVMAASAHAGFEAPSILTVVPSDGARRDA